MKREHDPRDDPRNFDAIDRATGVVVVRCRSGYYSYPTYGGRPPHKLLYMEPKELAQRFALISVPGPDFIANGTGSGHGRSVPAHDPAPPQRGRPVAAAVRSIEAALARYDASPAGRREAIERLLTWHPPEV
jgi:hypothetical protein